MSLEQFITYAIYIHAFFGGIGLIAGIGSILVKKEVFGIGEWARFFQFQWLPIL